MTLDLWQFLAGLGLFLFAMRLLEQALQGLATQPVRRLLRQQTNTPLRGLVLGILGTLCLQSSSMVGLLILAFVGAGILQLKNALGIILGINLGTTFTGWLVALIGFKLNLTAYALPLIALGTLGAVFLARESRPWHYASLVLGLGLLLFGLDLMKASMEFLRALVPLSTFQNYPLLLYFLGGVLFTALIQSSSATIIILLGAMNAGLIPLNTAAAVAIGANLGTTSTLLIGGLGGSAEKKRVALSHLAFNLVTSVLALLLLMPLLFLIIDIFGIDDPLYSLVSFHSLFNLLGVLLFWPFLGLFSRWLERRFVRLGYGGCRYFPGVPTRITDAAVEAVSQDIERLFGKVILLNLQRLRLSPKAILNHYGKEVQQEIQQEKPTLNEQYADIKTTETEILRYSYRVMKEKAAEQESERLSTLLMAARNAVYSAKCLRDIQHNLTELEQAEHRAVRLAIAQDCQEIYQQFIQRLTTPYIDEENAQQSAALQAQINQSHDRLHTLISGHLIDHQEEVPDSSLLNINREVFVSNQSLATAIALLLKANHTGNNKKPVTAE